MTEPLPLVPGESLGPFRLGSFLFNILNHVRSFRSRYPSVKLAWDEESPSSSPIHLTLSSPPLHLTFTPFAQRLARIQVLGSDPAAWVSYRGKRLRASSPDEYAGAGEEEDVVKTVRRVLGPTYGSSKRQSPGTASTPAEEMLSYPGVAFGVVRKGAGSTLSRIIVTALPAPEGVHVDQAWLHSVLPESPAIAQGDLRLAEIHLDSFRRLTHVQLHFHSPASSASADTPSIAPIELKIGETTSEDILCGLGAAIRTFWKEDDRLSIHTASLGPSSPDAALEPNPYFLSYPHLGLTLLISTTTNPHVLQKVILHANLPGEVQFGRTARAAWVLRGAGEGEGEVVRGEEGWSAVKAFLLRSGGDSSSAVEPSRRKGSPRAQQPVADLLGLSDGEEREQPMILDRTADGRDGVRGKTTEIHGFPGLALEVTGTGDIETVWLF